MRVSILAAIAAGAAVALPAAAQTSSPGASGSSGTAGQQSGGAQAGSQSLVVPRGEIRSELEKAGFKNVRILDAAYLVQAETSANEAVLMVVNPSGQMRNVLGGGASGAQQSGGSGTQPSGGSGTQPSGGGSATAPK